MHDHGSVVSGRSVGNESKSIKSTHQMTSMGLPQLDMGWLGGGVDTNNEELKHDGNNNDNDEMIILNPPTSSNIDGSENDLNSQSTKPSLWDTEGDLLRFPLMESLTGIDSQGLYLYLYIY